MKRIITFAATSAASLLIAGLNTAPAYAWHPQGAIMKGVSNQTSGATTVDANTASAAVSAQPGDVLVYTVTVSNHGAADSRGYNDMAATKLTDTLPAGVELVSNASQRTITEDLGTIKPGNSITKNYSVKVTSTTDGDVLTNKACFTGNSTANDNPQSGCDVAVVKVTVPPAPTPTPTPTPTGTASNQPVVMPDTGSTGLTAGLVTLSAVTFGFVLNTLRLKRQV